jgi:hypothetical protein
MGARALAEIAGTLYAAARASNAMACGAGMTLLETHVQSVVAEVPPA